MCEYGESNSSLSLGKATRYHYAILAKLLPPVRRLPDWKKACSGVRIDLLDENLLGSRAHDLFGNFSALEEKQGGDVVDIVLLGELGLLIDVDFDDLDLVGQFPGNFVEQWSDHLARAAPFSPKIDDDQFVGLQYLALEIERSNGRNIRTHYQQLIRKADKG